MTDPGFPHGPAHPPARTELLVIWGETQADASMAGVFCLGLDPRRVFAVGNDGADTLRGIAPTAVLILPGANSDDVDDALHVACAAQRVGPHGVPFLDLRAVQA